MIFNFFFGNHKANALNAMSDVLAPIYRGLEALGHQVIGFGTGLMAAPTVNVLLESFGEDPFVDTLLSMKASQADGIILGLICALDIEGDFTADPLYVPGSPDAPDPRRRRDNLLRLLPRADFVWTLLQQLPAYEASCGSGKAALVEYGFAGACVDPWPIREPGLRDIDVALYGIESAHRNGVTKALQRGGLTVVPVDRSFYPDFLADDLIRRARVFLDMRREAGTRFLFPPSIAKAVHFGVPVVAERFDTSPLASLYQYTAASEHDGLVARVTELARSQGFVEAGLAARTRFRAETSMRDNMHRALALPVFERLAAAEAARP